MARKYQELEREIQRIEGQLLVAKQICRENLKEIHCLKKQQDNDPILQQTNSLLANKSLHSAEHAEQFNHLLRSVHEQQTSALDRTMQPNIGGDDGDRNNSVVATLASNVTQLESFFEHTKSLFTQPITSVNPLDSTLSLRQIADDLPSAPSRTVDTVQIRDLQHRIESMREKLGNIDQSDDCAVQ